MALPVERMTSAGDVYVWLLALPAMNAPRRLMSGVSMICLRKKIDVCFINVSDALTFDQMVQPSSHRGRGVSAEVMTRFRLLTEEDTTGTGAFRWGEISEKYGRNVGFQMGLSGAAK